MKKKLMIAAAAALSLLLALSAAACGNKSAQRAAGGYAYTEGSFDTAYYAEEAAEAEMDLGISYKSTAANAAAPKEAPADSGSGGDTAAADSAARKIIYSATMRITADDPAAALEALKAKAEALGGYLLTSDTVSDDEGASRVTATIRVPESCLEALVTAAKGTGKVTEYSLSGDDITSSYYDAQARLNNAKAEEAQLLELYKACETVEELMLVRDRLYSVRSDIESYEGTMKLWNELTTYATLNVTVRRTAKTAVDPEEKLVAMVTLEEIGKEIGNGLQNCLRILWNAGTGLVVLVITLLPVWGLLFLLVGIPVLILRKRKRDLLEGRRQETPRERARRERKEQAAARKNREK